VVCVNRRDALKSFAAASAVSSSFSQSNPPKRRPNILYLHSHDTGRYIQPYGKAVPAPNLQRLAEQGVLFRNAHDANPTCSPARACLLTGQCAHSNGMLGLAHRGFAMTDYRRHILHTLRAEGYYSELAGLQHIAQDPAIIGYDHVAVTKSKRAEHVTPAAVSFLQNIPKQPFFLDVGFFETHREFHTPGAAEDSRYLEPPETVPDTPATRADMAGFKASARVLDSAVGEVLRALESSGQGDNTLVICTTDHGVAFPEMKCNLTNHGTGVMLIVRGPGGFQGGKACDSLTSQIDLFPTICDLLEIRHPSWLEGRSLMPVIRGQKDQVNDEIFAEVNYHAAYEPKRRARSTRWNYIRNYDPRHKPVLPNCDDGLSKTVWLDHGWKDRSVAPEELYDLTFDPRERRNMASEPSCAKDLAEMRAKLAAWMKDTNDPLLRGPVPLPPGAVVNDINGISPKDKPARY
jgi:N-sulfoglucosamine sulfohydrolase